MSTAFLPLLLPQANSSCQESPTSFSQKYLITGTVLGLDYNTDCSYPCVSTQSPGHSYYSICHFVALLFVDTPVSSTRPCLLGNGAAPSWLLYPQNGPWHKVRAQHCPLGGEWVPEQWRKSVPSRERAGVLGLGSNNAVKRGSWTPWDSG